MIELHLAIVEQHVAMSVRHIARQVEIIATLRRRGNTALEADASQLLAMLEEMQALHESHRDRLLKELETKINSAGDPQWSHFGKWQ